MSARASALRPRPGTRANQASGRPPSSAWSWWRAPLEELSLFWAFTGADLTASVIPATLFAIAAARVTGLRPPGAWIGAGARVLCYMSLYIYSFCLSNQMTGVEEDRINKPGRPIPRGLVSRRGAALRWLAVMILFPAVALWLGGYALLAWALGWQCLSVLYNFFGWSRHWVTKNLVVMSLGTAAALVPAWRLVAEMTPLAWRWVLVISLVNGACLCLQDLRDVEGDRAAGRRTLPIVVGDGAARIALSACFLGVPIVTSAFLRGPGGLTPAAVALDAASAALCLTIAARTLVLRSKEADRRTYRLWGYWYCLEIAGAIFTMPGG